MLIGASSLARSAAAVAAPAAIFSSWRAERLDLDAADDVVGEGEGQQAAGLVQADAARAQVEDRFVVELADRGAVRAFHVVGEDLQLRLGVDGRVVGQQQRLVGLLGVGLLGVLADEDLAVEDAAGLAVEDALVQLVAGAVRLGVVDDRVVVDELPCRSPGRGR